MNVPFRDRVAEAAQAEIERRGHIGVIVVPAEGPARIVMSFAPEATDVGLSVAKPEVGGPPASEFADGADSPSAPQPRAFYVPRHEAIQALEELKIRLEQMLAGNPKEGE